MDRYKACRGTSLTEVLVSVVVLSIGLLGLAGLQTTSLRNNHSAYLRSLATMLSYDLADRMRANMAGVAAGGYHLPTATRHAGCTGSSGCAPAQMAQNDYYEWSQLLANRLPEGEGVVCLDGTPNDGTFDEPACDGAGGLFAIKVWWDDERSGGAKRFVTSLQP